MVMNFFYKLQKLTAAYAALCPVIMSLFCVNPPRTGPVDRSDYPLRVQKLRGSVYLVEDGNYWKTNTVYYANDEHIVFVNATYLPKTAGRVIWKAMASGYGEFYGVVLTSFQIHHTGGLKAFHDRNIPSFSNYSTDAMMRARWPFMLGEMNYFQSWIDPPRMEITRRFRMKPNEKKWLIKNKVQIIYTGPGHTKDNIAVYFPEEKVLYAGSMLSDPLFFKDRINKAAMLQSVRILEKIDADLIVCGHGKAVCDRSVFTRVKQELSDDS